jgi:hypothetical protein
MEAGPVLVAAFRGVDAAGAWARAVGPTDPMLARVTDPHR